MTTALVLDSVTALGPQTRGRAALAASHGGVYAAYLAAKAGLKGVILCDAGVGREQAGIGGLAFLDALGVPCAAVGHRTARIGDGEDCLRRGVISFANDSAAALGLFAGMMTREALSRLARAALLPCAAPPPLQEARRRLREAGAPGVQVFALDSNALVAPDDAGHVIVTGSHGGLLGGRPQTAVKVDVFAAIYNDADRGVDDAGISRLPALQARNIAGAAVSAFSARIGDGLSTYRDGYVTALNDKAIACGGEIGLSAAELVRRLVAARAKEIQA